MKWVRGSLLTPFARLTALGGLVVTATCTDANESLIIMQAQVPDSMCVVSDAPDNAIRMAYGILDVALDKPYGYRLNPLVRNQLIPAGTATDIEPNRVTINAASLKIVPPPGISIPFTNECAAEFDHPTAASLPPGETRAVSIEAVRSCHAAMFADLFRSGRLNPSVADSVYFRVVVRVKGRHGGSDIESDPFEYPLKVCYGCLQTGFTGQYAAFNFPEVPACERLAENPFIGNARCGLPAQDSGPILCCAKDAAGTSLQCPGVPTAMPAP
jgi:hypothetical protein